MSKSHEPYDATDNDDWLEWDTQPWAADEVPVTLRAFVEEAMLDKVACRFWIDGQDPDNEMLLAHLGRRSDAEAEAALLEAIHAGARLLVKASATLAFFAIPQDPDQQMALAARIGAASLVGLARGDGLMGMP
jgi:hypothetical protein